MKIFTLLIFVLSLGLIITPVEAAPMSGQIMVDLQNPRWFVYNRDTTGPFGQPDGQLDPFFLSGAGGPENFLFGGFTGASNQEAIINSIRTNGMNGIYMIADASGDGSGRLDTASEISQAHQWFQTMENNGIVIYFIFYDDSVGHTSDAWVTQMVNEFKKYKHLIWCVAEEYSEALSKTTANQVAQLISSADNFDHPVAIHQLESTVFDFKGSANFQQFGLQSYNNNYHQIALTAYNNAANPPYNVNISEHHGIDVATVSDATYRQAIWAMAIGGAYHMQLGTWENTKNRKSPSTNMMNYSRDLVDFFEMTDFNRMAPNDSLKTGSTDYVMARSERTSFIAYTDSYSGSMGVADLSGTYNLMWLDIVNKKFVNQTNITPSGNTFTRPGGITGSEIALYMKKSGGGTLPTYTPAPTSTTNPTGAVNQAPQAFSQSVVTETGKAVVINLRIADDDGPGPNTYSVIAQPVNGVLQSFTNNNDWTYTPKAGFVGTDSFQWRVSDGKAVSNIATASITIGQSWKQLLSGWLGNALDVIKDGKVNSLDWAKLFN